MTSGALRRERHRQIDAGVHEEAQPVVVAERQRVEPGEMLRARCVAVVIAHRGSAPLFASHSGIARTRACASIAICSWLPRRHTTVPGRAACLAHQQLDHAAAVRPAIDVVAEKDVARRPRAGVGLARREQALKLVEAAVNIADREGER